MIDAVPLMKNPNFSIQIHPHRAPELDIANICAICNEIALEEADIVSRFSFVEGHDGHAYLNLNFQTSDVRKLWKRLKTQLYDGAQSKALQRSSMAMCEGKYGWDDYLLLYHYDPNVDRDVLPDEN